MAKLIAATMLVITLVGCGNQYDRQLKQIEWFFGWGQTGSSRDCMLVKYGIAGARSGGFLDFWMTRLFAVKWPNCI